jgi:adenosylcobinamide-phosphate synthase
MELRFLTLALALGIDKLFGEPDILWKTFPHPVIWFGKAIERGEFALNKSGDTAYIKRRNGFLLIFVLLLLAGVTGALLHWVLSNSGFAGLLIEALLASVFLAHKSLVDHVGAVAIALRTGGVEAGRVAVSHIVGRDTGSLDGSGVCRAGIESLAENFADGVIAPAFWYLLAGLPGLLAYKMLNTADSMIGHMNERYLDFGRAAAKLDDAANFIPARLTGVLYACAVLFANGFVAARRSLAVMMRDARLHRSPNSGWPEAALAGGLDIALAGPRVYNGVSANEPLLNSGGARQIEVGDVDRAIKVTNSAHGLFCLCMLVFAFTL